MDKHNLPPVSAEVFADRPSELSSPNTRVFSLLESIDRSLEFIEEEIPLNPNLTKRFARSVTDFREAIKRVLEAPATK